MMLWTVYVCGHEHKHICFVWGFSITTKENHWYFVGYYHHLPHISSFQRVFPGYITFSDSSLIPSAYESIWLHICLPFTLDFLLLHTCPISPEFSGVFLSNLLSYMAYRLFLFFGVLVVSPKTLAALSSAFVSFRSGYLLPLSHEEVDDFATA